jgi:hypothetical protein
MMVPNLHKPLLPLCPRPDSWQTFCGLNECAAVRCEQKLLLGRSSLNPTIAIHGPVVLLMSAPANLAARERGPVFHPASAVTRHAGRARRTCQG